MTNIELRQVKNPQGYHRTSIEWADLSANPLRAVVKHDVWVRDGHVVGTVSSLGMVIPLDDPYGERAEREGEKIVKKGTVGWACSMVSAGCAHCYASAINRRFGTGLRYTEKNLKHVELVLDEQRLQRMLTQRFKKPRTPSLTLRAGTGSTQTSGVWKNGANKPVCFIGDMTDLALCRPEELDRLYAVMALRPDVLFMVLTKRPERMAEYLTKRDTIDCINQRISADHDSNAMIGGEFEPIAWPLPNVWHGTSAEDQKTADERIPHLLRVPGPLFLSLEPLLGGIDLRKVKYLWGHLLAGGAEHWWIIGGGESGAGARGCDVSWLRSLKEQCAAAGVPFFLKQLGSHVIDRNDVGFDADEIREQRPDGSWGPYSAQAWPSTVQVEEFGHGTQYQSKPVRVRLRDSKGGDMSEWPEGLRVREMPEEVARHPRNEARGTGEEHHSASCAGAESAEVVAREGEA